MGQLPSFVVLLLAILSVSSCSMYCITPMSMDSDDTNSSCVTLSQFARSTCDENSSVILVFEPGNHTLSIVLRVFNKSEFRMVSSGSSDAKIVCESQGKLTVQKVDSVVIDGLTFVGCKENTFVQVGQQLILNTTTFVDAENSTSLLTLRGVTSAKVYNSTFLSNRARSSDHADLYKHNGAIISNNASNLSIYDSVFQDNDARAIFSELGEKLVLNQCRFLRNSANYGGVIYAAKTKLEINECTFSYNTAGEAGFRIIFLINGLTKIIRTNFTENSEVLFAEHNNIAMTDCHFKSNYVPVLSMTAGFTQFVNTTYDAIVLVINSNTTMIHSTFFANEAIENGGILVFGNAMVMLKDTNFIKNKAFEGTIVLISSDAIFAGSIEFESNTGCLSALQSRILFAGNASFSNGTSSTREHDIIRGGAVTLYFSTLNFTGSYSKTEFVDNNAINGGALYAAESIVYIDTEVMIADNQASIVGGGVCIYRSSLLVHANMTVSSNQAELGGGIYAESAAITVTSSQTSSFHYLMLENNTATDGGGFYISSNAHIYVYQLDPTHHYITVRLTFNHAQRGGAIYANDETNTGMCNGRYSITGQVVSSECFFQVVDLYRESGSVGLIFESNDASSGSVMFGGLLDRCLVTALTMSSFFDTDLGTSFAPLTGLPYLVNVSNHSFQIDDSNSIVSAAVKVCICSKNKPNCSVLKSQRHVERGSEFNVSVAAVDQAENLVNTMIIAELLSSTGGLGEGQQSQMVNSSCTNLTYSVTSSKNYEKIVIYADGPCRSAIPSRQVVNVTFSNCFCPTGFEVNSQMSTTCECICSSLLEGPFIDGCTVENQSITKVSNSWIDYRNDIGFLFSYRCPYNYCVSNLSVNLNTDAGSNVQCANNRAGALCGSCQQNYSLSLDQTSCVICDRIWPLYTVFITLAALILGLCIVVIILFLNLTITSGTINGFIFSANILKAIFPFPSQMFPTYLVTFLNLDIGLNICYYDGLDIYVKTWLELGFPLYLIFIVAMVIILSRYSPTFARCIGKRNPIETLATLIFLSYAKLLQFPILALSCGELFRVDETVSVYKRVWLPDASIGCFDNKHVVMFTVGLVIMVLVLIYTLLIFSWQWIVKLPNWKLFAVIRNTKLQSFIEMHHIPYTSGHRYWTGLLLLVRILVYVVEVGFDPFATYLTVIVTLSALFIIKSLSTRVYKKWPVDVLESMLIVNTITLAAVAFYTSTTRSTNIPKVATYLSTCVMGILLIVVIVYHLHHQVLKDKLNYKKWLCFRKSKHPTEPTIEVEESDSSQREAARNRSRHPLSGDRFHSVLLVMGNVTDSDYNQLDAQQELERNAESTEEDQNSVPVQPTVSVLEVPFSGQCYVPYNGNS